MRAIKTHLQHILKISWPIIVGQLGMILTGFFDNLMVSKLGYDELAAAGISNSVFFLIAVFPMGITMAFATIISILKGKKLDHDGAFVFRDATLITVVIALLSAASILLAVHYFDIFRQAEVIETLAKPYLSLLAYSAIPMLFFFLLKNISDGYHYTLGGMIVTLTSLALNVFLNWVFIYGNLGSEAYGLNGAGYATILSRIFSVFMMAWFLFKHKRIDLDFKRIAHAFANLGQNRYFKGILNLGIPTGFQFFFEVAAFALAAIMAGWIGPKSLAAHNMAITVAALTYMFASGISSGASISIAQSYGDGNTHDIRMYGKSALLLSVCTMTLFAVLFYIFNVDISRQFSQDSEVIRIGAQLLVIAAIFQLSDGIQAVSIGLLRGIEDVRLPSFITLIAYWTLAMPLGYYLGFERNMGAEGIWIGLTLGLSFSALLLCSRFYYLLQKRTI